MANSDRIPIHFFLTNVSKRIQNMDISKIPTRENLVDVIVMLSIRPAEVRSLQINYYELNSSNISSWYKEGYSWYCTGYLKSRGEKKKNPDPRPFLSMEKNPKRARELLTWIQDAIKLKSYLTLSLLKVEQVMLGHLMNSWSKNLIELYLKN